ncbi:MAG: autotransporter-associated beta strand repeat-containing protein [Luteolibacter sp.]
MKLKKSNRLQCLTVCLTPATIALSLMIAMPALATDVTWSGTAGDNLFNTATNWSTGTVPTAGNAAAGYPSDNAIWSGSQAGPLSILWNGQVGAYDNRGISLVVTGGQVGALALNNTANGNSLGISNITINQSAGAFTLGGTTGSPIVALRAGHGTTPKNSTFSNDSANTATIKSNITFQSGEGAPRSITFDGAGNWLIENALVTSNGGALTLFKNGAGTVTVTNSNTSQNSGYTINAGTLAASGAGLLGGPSGVFSGTLAVVGGTLSYQSTASQTISSAISGAGALTQGAGTLTLTGNNSRTGTTTVTGGTMVLSGAGQSVSTGLTINGAAAKFVQTSSVASTVPITLTQGILDGTGSVGTVTVGNGTGGIIKNGNGGTGALTIGNLTFSGAGSINFAEDGVTTTPGVIVTGALSTSGVVTVNASQTTWASGSTFDLMTFGSFGGTIANFTKGTIAGVSVRQSATLVLGANKLSLTISGDNPVWTGLDSGNWVIGSTGANGNWKTTAGQTNYIAGDTVLFDDTVTTGTTAVTLSTANVSPALSSFNNSTKDYTVSGAFGIAGGSVIKTGTGKVTFSTANTYNGGTTASAGTLALSGAGTLGVTTNALTVNGTGIVDLGTTSRTVGTVSLSDTGAITNGTITPTTVSATSASAAVISASIAGSGNVVQAGSGSLTLSGANTYSGGTTATSGSLILSGAGTLGATTGALNLNGATLDLGTTSQTVGAVTKSGSGTVSNGTLAFTVFNDTHTVGTGTVSAKLTGSGALNLTGAGGTLILTGANDYSGPTLVASGTILRLGDGGTTGSLSPLSDITVQNGGRFSTNRSDTVTQGVDFGLLTGGVQGGFIGIGTGTTILNLANTFTAGGTMSAGTVVAASNGALGTGVNGGFSITGGSLHLKNDITMPVSLTTAGAAAASDTVGSIMSTGTNTLTGAISFGNVGGTISNIVSLSGTLTINGGLSTSLTGGRTFNFGGPGNTVVSGAITGEVSVTKSGAGTTTLMNATGNSYTGGTMIRGGTLRIQGTNVGLVTIDGAAAVLAGTGTIGGDVTLVNGGIAPGDGVTPIGTLALSDTLYLSPANSTFNLDLSSVDNSSDLVTTGALIRDVDSTVAFNFSGGMVGQTYTLFQFGGTNFNPGDLSAFVVTGGTGTFNLTVDNKLTYTVATVASTAGYASWSTTNAGGQTANLDYDKDGVSNGIEYFMGQTGSSFTANPGLVSGTVSWPKDPAYLGTYAVQTSTDLVNWVPASPAPVVVGNTVQYTPGTGLGKIFTRLVVTPN